MVIAINVSNQKETEGRLPRVEFVNKTFYIKAIDICGYVFKQSMAVMTSWQETFGVRSILRSNAHPKF